MEFDLDVIVRTAERFECSLEEAEAILEAAIGQEDE